MAKKSWSPQSCVSVTTAQKQRLASTVASQCARDALYEQRHQEMGPSFYHQSPFDDQNMSLHPIRDLALEAQIVSNPRLHAHVLGKCPKATANLFARCTIWKALLFASFILYGLIYCSH